MRNKLIQKLSERWRRAENYFLETENDIEKVKTKNYQDRLNLTKEETQELNRNLDSMGIWKARKKLEIKLNN